MWQGGTLPKTASTNLTHGKTNAVTQYISQGNKGFNNALRLPPAPAGEVGGFARGGRPVPTPVNLIIRRSVAEPAQKNYTSEFVSECVSSNERSRSQ